jgi:hypothetical protein
MSIFNDGFVLKQMFALLRGRQVNEETSSAMNVRLKLQYSGFQEFYIQIFFIISIMMNPESNPPFACVKKKRGTKGKG